MTGFLRREAQRFANNCIWSLAGWRAAWATERTLRQWTLVNAASAVLAFSLDLTPGERALILSLGVLVLAAELLNTAIEETVDYISTGEHPMARKAKDCGSAGVALAALAGGLAWAVILVG
jgi:diacylglycerol kinase (ATP)